jgi:hypothetical protein
LRRARKILAPIFLLLLFFSPRTLAEEVETPRLFDFVANVPGNLLEWSRETFASDKIAAIGGMLGMTGILIASDFESWQAMRLPYMEYDDLQHFADWGVRLGDGSSQFALAGGFLLFGALTSDSRALRTASQIAEAILVTGVVVQTMKHTTGRESPFLSEERTGIWRFFPNQGEYMGDYQKFDAMPSGHLATAMTTFIVIQENYPDQKWIPYVGYPLVGWVAWGLVATSLHWWSDFPIALSLGYSFGKIVTAKNSKTPKPASKNQPRLAPGLTPDGHLVFQATWNW